MDGTEHHKVGTLTATQLQTLRQHIEEKLSHHHHPPGVEQQLSPAKSIGGIPKHQTVPEEVNDDQQTPLPTILAHDQQTPLPTIVAPTPAALVAQREAIMNHSVSPAE